MGGEEAAFLRAICENPADDTPRLVYADWLEERGDPHGELIRVQCALAAWPCACDSEERVYHEEECRCNEKYALLHRESQLLIRHFGDFFPPPVPGWLFDLAHGPAGAEFGWCDLSERARVRVTVRRGFVASVTLPAAAFLDHAAALFAAAPAEEVRLSDLRPRQWLRDLYWYDEMPDALAKALTPFGPQDATPLLATAAGAEATLSALCVAYGRAAAGLPTLGGEAVGKGTR